MPRLYGLVGLIIATPLWAETQLFPSSIVMKKGTVSAQPITVLSVQDQTGTADDWNRYKDFTPISTGLNAHLSFTLPVGIDLAKTMLSLKVNYRGWHKAKQVWKFALYDYAKAAWTPLGDNTQAASWSWSVLNFTAPGNLTSYAKDGKVLLRYWTASGLENSNLDYIGLILNGPPPPPLGSLPGTGRIPAGPLYGLTLDSVYGLNDILASLERMAKRTTVRIVFDEYVPPSEYRNAVYAI